MHICPVCASAAVVSAAATVPLITRLYWRIKSWFKARTDKGTKPN